MKKSGYMTRAMKASDPRYARILGRLGYERGDLVARSSADERPSGEGEINELTATRALYFEVLGKRPYHAWDVDELRKRIAEAKDA